MRYQKTAPMVVPNKLCRTSQKGSWHEYGEAAAVNIDGFRDWNLWGGVEWTIDNHDLIVAPADKPESGWIKEAMPAEGEWPRDGGSL